MYALLLRTPDATAEGQQLLEDLDSDTREVRDRATRLLGNLFDRYKDLIQQKLQDKSSSAEVRSRLKNIVANEADSKLVRQTIAAFDLVNDPQYVVSFLDDADPKEFIKIVRHLEKISGQKLGTDPAAWKEWANSKASNN